MTDFHDSLYPDQSRSLGQERPLDCFPHFWKSSNLAEFGISTLFYLRNITQKGFPGLRLFSRNNVCKKPGIMWSCFKTRFSGEAKGYVEMTCCYKQIVRSNTIHWGKHVVMAKIYLKWKVKKLFFFGEWVHTSKWYTKCVFLAQSLCIISILSGLWPSRARVPQVTKFCLWAIVYLHSYEGLLELGTQDFPYKNPWAPCNFMKSTALTLHSDCIAKG